MGFYRSESKKGQQATIRTGSGKEVSGKIAYEEKYSPGFGEIVAGIATCGLSVLFEPADKTTVVDNKGNYWTGKRK